MHSRLFAVLGLLLVASAAGCATPPGRPPGSGFLGDTQFYRGLERSPRSERAWTWRAPGRSLAEFDAVTIDPVEVWPAPASGLQERDPGQVRRLADEFRAVLAAALEDRYPVVDGAAPGVLRVRAAITGVDPAVPLLGFEGALGKREAGRGNVTMEADLRDAATGERVAAVLARGAADEGSRHDDGGWARVRQVLDGWGAALRERMDAEHDALR